MLIWSNNNTIKNFTVIYVFEIFIRVWAQFVIISDNISGVLKMMILKLDYVFAPLLLFLFCKGQSQKFNFLSIYLTYLVD